MIFFISPCWSTLHELASDHPPAAVRTENTGIWTRLWVRMTFQQWKAAAIAKADQSRKGNIDARILDVINFINNNPDYFTTSSCSGRILICSDDVCVKSPVDVEQSVKSRKSGCIWYLVSHEVIDACDAVNALSAIKGSSKLKFEPFILHVQCSDLSHAHAVHTAAVEAGFRNSGITLGKSGKKIIAAVRGSACLEVPLTSAEGTRLTTDDYVGHIARIANEKLLQNFLRITLFEEKLKHSLENLKQKSLSNKAKKIVREKKKHRIVEDDGEELDFMDVGLIFEES